VSQSESETSPQVVQALEASGCRLFRNNIGCAKFGQFWVHYGVGGKGGADHIGYLPVRITQEMVGHYVAVFVAPEVKRPKGARYTTEQVIFRDNVLAAGGIAGFCHSWEQGRSLVMDWFARFKAKPSKKIERRIKKA